MHQEFLVWWALWFFGWSAISKHETPKEKLTSEQMVVMRPEYKAVRWVDFAANKDAAACMHGDHDNIFIRYCS